ncbi:hypothetical protein [Rhodococcus opacus]|uniref:hypothetical protein n=1 Tax=Rhodococcus opacus TaxID=37919 RepID=UPI001C44B006|nr:hypothetical protein [Rhodococcus opacus]MBV6763054.1 hypothetical protein [Rhodococcus opacus]
MATNLRTLRYSGLYIEAETVVDGAKKDAENVRTDQNLSITGRVARLAALDKEHGWTAKLDAITEELARRTDEAETAVATVHANVTVRGGDNAAEILLGELRAGRYWARTKIELDAEAGANRAGLVARLIADAPAADLATLLEELPTYLRVQGIDVDVDTLVARRFPELAKANAAARWARTFQVNAVAPVVAYAREVVASVNTPQRASGAAVMPFALVLSMEERADGELGIAA